MAEGGRGQGVARLRLPTTLACGCADANTWHQRLAHRGRVGRPVGAPQHGRVQLALLLGARLQQRHLDTVRQLVVAVRRRRIQIEAHGHEDDEHHGQRQLPKRKWRNQVVRVAARIARTGARELALRGTDAFDRQRLRHVSSGRGDAQADASAPRPHRCGLPAACRVGLRRGRRRRRIRDARLCPRPAPPRPRPCADARARDVRFLDSVTEGDLARRVARAARRRAAHACNESGKDTAASTLT